MRLRKIIYHGTTMLRWEMIKKDGLLRPNNEIEDYSFYDPGYVYFTDDISYATMYGFHKSLSDSQYLDDSQVKSITSKPNYSGYSRTKWNLRDW